MRVSVNSAVAGASLLSAGATLPLHLLPILVLALSTGSEFPAAQAGWVGSMYMLGQLACVLALPAVGVKAMPVRAAAVCALLILLAAGISTLRQPYVVLGSWLCVGSLAGALQYLGTTTAAAAPDPKNAFAWRMATSSIFGAALMVWLQFSRARLTDYGAVSMQFMALFAVIATVGLFLYGARPAQDAVVTPSAVAGDVSTRATSARLVSGLLILFVLFVGQQGLWSVVMQSANLRGFDLQQILWAAAASKLAAASLMIFGIWRNSNERRGTSLVASGIVVAAGGLTMGWAGGTFVYVIGLAMWEIALNVLSARLQAALAQVDRRRAGMWITAGIFMGAAVGHAVAPLTVAHGALAVFALFSAATAIAPSLWRAWSNRSWHTGVVFGKP